MTVFSFHTIENGSFSSHFSEICKSCINLFGFLALFFKSKIKKKNNTIVILHYMSVNSLSATTGSIWSSDWFNLLFAHTLFFLISCAVGKAAFFPLFLAFLRLVSFYYFLVAKSDLFRGFILRKSQEGVRMNLTLSIFFVLFLETLIGLILVSQLVSYSVD